MRISWMRMRRRRTAKKALPGAKILKIQGSTFPKSFTKTTPPYIDASKPFLPP